MRDHIFCGEEFVDTQLTEGTAIVWGGCTHKSRRKINWKCQVWNQIPRVSRLFKTPQNLPGRLNWNSQQVHQDCKCNSTRNHSSWPDHKHAPYLPARVISACKATWSMARAGPRQRMMPWINLSGVKEGYAELLPDLAMENWSVVVIASQVDHLNLVTFHCHVCGPKGESQSHAWDRAWRLPRNFGHGERERERERDIYIYIFKVALCSKLATSFHWRGIHHIYLFLSCHLSGLILFQM